MAKVKRDYKSRMFTMIFSDKKELLKLYNAVANRNYEDPELLEITTLDNAVYMSMKNDVAFIVAFKVSLFEHQTTYNPNMPLRFLMYLADLYSKLVADKNLYGRKLIMLYAPQFIVFYNGVEERPEEEELKLSDAYMIKEKDPSLELKVTVLNINKGYNEELKSVCKTLKDYADYVEKVRFYRARSMSIEEAVELAIEECIKEDKLKEFLIRNRAEAKAVSIYEYNEEEHMKMEKADSYEDGREVGREEGLHMGIVGMIESCKELGVSQELIVEKVVEKYQLAKEEAIELYKKVEN